MRGQRVPSITGRGLRLLRVDWGGTVTLRTSAGGRCGVCGFKTLFFGDFVWSSPRETAVLDDGNICLVFCLDLIGVV
jgi:hypothetical protein